MNRANEVLSVRSGAQASSEAPTVFVIDDDNAVREDLEAVIAAAGWQPRSFNSARAFLDCPRLMTPACLVSDTSPPDLDGLQLQRHLADRSELPIIFMTSRVDLPVAVQAMRAGAIEFLTKPIMKDALLIAVRQALESSGEALRRESEMSALRQGYTSLSCRERQVMGFLIQGAMNKQVGAELGISEITVKAHRGNLMRKMQARSLAELVTIAALLGLVPMRTKPQPYVATARPASGRASNYDRFRPKHLIRDTAYPAVAGVSAFASG